MVVLGGKKKDLAAAEDYKELYEECFTQAKQLVSREGCWYIYIRQIWIKSFFLYIDYFYYLLL